MLVVSRLSEQEKRISLVLKAWEKFRKKKNWELIIVGDGPNKIDYENYVKKKDLKNVIFTGRMDPKPFYREAKIFLMTSSYEGWGLTILEAMQFGVVPVVMNSCSVFHDMIVNGYNGLLLENNDLDVYINNLEELVLSNEKLQMLSINALKTASCFNSDKLLSKWFNS